MYKNQLQELAQRSCFNLPSYACIREGPDHAPRFKASVNFNGEIFESPFYCSTLRQAEHSAAEVALNILSTRGPSRSLTARVLDETGVYKNLLQETAHRAGLNLPVYTTVRSGPGHIPIFTCTVELAGMSFKGEPAKTKKQAQKNAAISAWSTLKRMPNAGSMANKEEHDEAVVEKVLSNLRPKEEINRVRKRDPSQSRRKMVRGSGDNVSSASSYTSINSLQYNQQWRLLDLLMNKGSECRPHKQNYFTSLLPPPPPPTSSKILPPTSLKDNPPSYPSRRLSIPVQIRGRSHVIQPPLEEHQKDEEEWLYGKSDVKGLGLELEGASIIKSSSVKGIELINSHSAMPNAGKNQHEKPNIGIENNPFGSLNPPPFSSCPVNRTSSTHNIGRNMYSGGFGAHRIAPPVQIRSVIPVCAAPLRHSSSPSTSKNAYQIKENPSTPSTSMSTQTESEGLSSVSANLKFNKPFQRLDPSQQLHSEFDKLQL